MDFLKLLDSKYPQEKRIEVILDNHSAYTLKESRSSLKQHPGRFNFVITPKHGSWLNMIERFWGKFAHVCLRGIRVNSKAELEERIYQYIREINVQPVVYRWKYKMEDLVV